MKHFCPLLILLTAGWLYANVPAGTSPVPPAASASDASGNRPVTQASPPPAAPIPINDLASRSPQTRLAPPYTWRHYALCTGGGLLLLLLLLYFLARRRKKKNAPPPLPPHITALQALELLLEEHLPEQGLTMEYYNRIQQILREYIEARFGWQAPEQTTQEFLQRLPGSVLEEHRGLLTAFLSHCDLVRFANTSPTPEQIRDTAASCRSFLQKTAPKPPPPES